MTKAFISYHHGNDQWAKDYLAKLTLFNRCFEDLSVNTGDIADDNRSSEEIRRKIRDDYLRDSEVTILLCGNDTRGRKHVDWELKSSMIDGRINRKSGILVIDLLATSDERWFCSMLGEKSEIYSDYLDSPTTWFDVETKADFSSRWPHVPDRIHDNLVNPSAQISIVPWSRIVKRPDRLKWLVDQAAAAGRTNVYDLRRKMRRNNSPAAQFLFR